MAKSDDQTELDASMQEWEDLFDSYHSADTNTEKDKLWKLIFQKQSDQYHSFTNFDRLKPRSIPATTNHLLQVLELLSSKLDVYWKENVWSHRYKKTFEKVIELVEKDYNAIWLGPCLKLCLQIFGDDGLLNMPWKIGDETVDLLPRFSIAFSKVSYQSWHDYVSADLDTDYETATTVCEALANIDNINEDLEPPMFPRQQDREAPSHTRFRRIRDLYTDVADYLRLEAMKSAFDDRQVPEELRLMIRKHLLGPYRIDYDRLMAEYGAMSGPPKAACGSCWISEEHYNRYMSYGGWCYSRQAVPGHKSLTCPAVVLWHWKSQERRWVHEHAIQARLMEFWEARFETRTLECKFDSKTCKGHYEDNSWALDQGELERFMKIQEEDDAVDYWARVDPQEERSQDDGGDTTE